MRRLGLAGVAAVAAVSLQVGAGVMDDCVMLFHGGSDYNGNGCFDDGELRDRLHPGTATDVVKRAWDFPADCITWTNMSVQCNCKSNVLENQTCLYFHQKGTVNNVLTDAACALELPRVGYADDVLNYNFTALFRIKLPAADTKADGTVLTGSDAGNNTACGTLAALGNSRESGQWKGTDLRVSHSTTFPCVTPLIQQWSSGKIWQVPQNSLTNLNYTTRDAEWVEIAVVGYTWTYNSAPAPGTYTYVFRWDGSSSAKNDGGRNAMPSINWPTLLGNNSAKAAAGGLQGAVHMVAMWNRTLSEAECKEAFKFLSGPTDTLANDGNNSGLYKFGYDENDGARFGGPAGVASTITAPNRYATDFPSNFTAGTKLTIRMPLDKFTKNMKQVLRLRTAADSATGTLSVKANDTVQEDQLAIAPSQTYLYFLPQSYFAGDEFTVELNCSAAGVGGVKLATVEVCGSWTIGLKDNSTTQIIPGVQGHYNSNNRTFTVGVDENQNFPVYWYDYVKNNSKSYTDIKFYIPEGLQNDFKYVFKGSSRGGYVDPTTGAPHDFTLNGTKTSERFFFTSVNHGKDYAMTIKSGDLKAGWNTIRCQNYMDNTYQSDGKTVKNWAYTYWDYVTLQLEKKTGGMMILLR